MVGDPSIKIVSTFLMNFCVLSLFVFWFGTSKGFICGVNIKIYCAMLLGILFFIGLAIDILVSLFVAGREL